MENRDPAGPAAMRQRMHNDINIPIADPSENRMVALHESAPCPQSLGTVFL
ncbi:MAG TPA: hypothetical protein VGL24_11985 [Chthoniobacterales bacterium]|jgi:hypothetical protein